MANGKRQNNIFLAAARIFGYDCPTPGQDRGCQVLLGEMDAELSYFGRIQLLYTFVYCLDADTEKYAVIHSAFSRIGPLHYRGSWITYFPRRAAYYQYHNRDPAHLHRSFCACVEREQETGERVT